MSHPEEPGDNPAPVLLNAFRAAMLAPHYADLVAQAGVDPGRIASLADFEQLVPVIRKDQLFEGDVPFHRLCTGGTLGAVRSIMVSSGFSGNNSFAVATAEELDETINGVDEAIEQFFGTSRTPTLLINALSMGVHLPTRQALAETGPRSDSVLKIVEHFAPYFGQFVILADPHVLKEIVDEGNQAGVDWQRRNVSFVSGGDWMPQTLHAYIRAQTGIGDGGSRLLMQTMGLTELGLNLFFESPYTVHLRGLAAADPSLRTALFPHSSPAVPSLFHYDPRRFHVESIPHPEGRELVVSALAPGRSVPMIRYATGDLGDLLPHQALLDALNSRGLGSLLPALPLPCAWVAGRAAGIQTAAGLVRSQDLRHGLYSDQGVAQAVTGHFTVLNSAVADCAVVQLRRGVATSEALRAATERALFSAVASALPTTIERYAEYRFGMDLNYEKKFHHYQHD